MSWNIIPDGDEFILLNKSDTKIRISKLVSEKRILELMTKLDEIDFPLDYSNGLKEIYMTNHLLNEGEYDWSGKIRLCVNFVWLHRLHAIFIHEIGHHVDGVEDVSHDPKLLKEWKKLSGSFVHCDIKTDPEEYFAMGFEKYYTDETFTEKSHPVLWKKIDEIHKKRVLK